MAKKKSNDARVANVVAHFNNSYPTHDGRLAAFQMLCEDLDVTVGRSITHCKKNIKSANVNIWDFMRIQGSGGDINTVKFRSKAALRQEIVMNPHRRFPLYKAKANELLEALLVDTGAR